MLPKAMKELAEVINFLSDSIQIWGNYKGYPFTLGCYGQDNAITVYTAISFADPGAYSILDTFFTDLKQEKKIADYKSSRGSFTLTVKSYLKTHQVNDLQALLDRITDKFQELGASPTCFSCNQTGEVSFARYNGVTLSVCNQCFSAINGKINQNLEEHGVKSNNYLSGIIGAVLGALLGSAVWVIIGLLGYVASIAGLAIAFAAAKGYTLFKGKITRLTPWIIGLCTLFGLVIGQFVTLDLLFYREFKDSISLIGALLLTFELPFIDPEITADFVKDTLIGLVFAALGSYGTIKNLSARALKPAGSIERV